MEKLLHKACRKGNIEKVLEIIQQNADIYDKNTEGLTPLMIALHHGHYDIAELLLNINPSRRHITKENALVYACEYCEIGAVQLLLQYRISPNKRTKGGITALMKAIIHKRIDVVQLLLDNRANVHIKDNYDRTALAHAFYKNQTDIIKLLVDHGSIINSTKDLNGNTMLSRTFWNKNYEMMKLVLEHNISIEDKNHTLAYAIFCNCNDLVSLLLEHGADPNSGRIISLLGAAIKSHNTSNMRKLLEYGADVNVMTWKRPILMNAMERGFTDVVKLLLEYGADIHKNNEARINAIDYASQISNLEIRSLIINR